MPRFTVPQAELPAAYMSSASSAASGPSAAPDRRRPLREMNGVNLLVQLLEDGGESAAAGGCGGGGGGGGRGGCSGRTAKGGEGTHRVNASDEELAVAAWLRENPKIAKKYGINDCNGKTRIGSMLLQVLAFMGGTAEWRERPPQQAEPPPKGSNASLSAMLASVKRRAGRAAQPNPQPGGQELRLFSIEEMHPMSVMPAGHL